MWIRIRSVIIEDEPLGRPVAGGIAGRDLSGRGRRFGHRERGGPTSLRRVAAGRGLCRHQSTGQRRCLAGKATGHASAAATPGLYDRKREPRHRRVPAGSGGLSFEAVGSGTSLGGGHSPAGIYAAL